MIKSIAIGRLYFNKTLVQFEDSLRRMISTLEGSGLIERVHIITSEGMAVDIARTKIVQRATNDFDVDAIAWLDTDMIYPDDALVRLVQMANDGHAMSAGLYRRGRAPYPLLCYTDEWFQHSTLADVQAIADDNGRAQVLMAAGGFSLVAMDVYRAIADKWHGNVPPYCNYDFIGGGGWVGEDTFFVMRAANVGFRPVVDVNLHAVHWPPHSTPISVVDNDPLLRYCEFMDV